MHRPLDGTAHSQIMTTAPRREARQVRQQQASHAVDHRANIVTLHQLLRFSSIRIRSSAASAESMFRISRHVMLG